VLVLASAEVDCAEVGGCFVLVLASAEVDCAEVGGCFVLVLASAEVEGFCAVFLELEFLRLFLPSADVGLFLCKQLSTFHRHTSRLSLQRQAPVLDLEHCAMTLAGVTLVSYTFSSMIAFT